MHGDKAKLLAEVQARMANNPDIAKGIGLEFADSSRPNPVIGHHLPSADLGDANKPSGAVGVCPFSSM